MAFPLTDEQLYAVDTLDVNCIVPAGAGSGKTRVLVERYLKIIETYSRTNPNILESVVAITFTEKAAKEMKERIRKGMLENRDNAITQGELELAKIWINNLHKLEHGSISTIHSFCAKILREFPIEANIDPEFKVLDETETDWILNETIEKILKSYLHREKNNGISPFYQWAILAGFEKTVKQIKHIFSQIANSGLELKEIEELTNNSFDQSPYELVDNKEKLIIAGDELFYSEEGNKKLKDFQNQWLNIRQKIINSKDGETGLIHIELLIQLTKGNFGTELKLIRKKVNDEAIAYKKWLSSIEYHIVEKEYISSFYQLIKEIDKAYLKEKEKVNGIDFDELQTKTIKLLKENQSVREQVQKRIKFLMIDEFQDNNQVQKRLISLILEQDGYIRPGSLFIVGDPKQSIYKFRGADVKVFKDMEQEITKNSGRIAPLIYNFRSNPQIIDFVNYFFPYLMSNDPSSANYYKEAYAKKEIDLDEAIEYIPVYSDDEAEENIREKEAYLIARRIEEILNQGVKEKEITILFRTLTNVKIYEQALAKKNISYYVVGGRGFYQKQEIYDLLNVFDYLIDPTNKIALAGILRSPMVAITDDTLYQFMKKELFNLNEGELSKRLDNINKEEQEKLIHFLNWLNELKQNLGRVKVSELLEDILELTQYKAILHSYPLGNQKVANVDKFIRIANEFTIESPYSIFEFMSKIKRLMDDQLQEKEAAIEAETGNTVKIMTIHQSKGLEFPYVFIADISRKPVYDDLIIRFDSSLGISCKIPINNEEWISPTRWLSISNKEKQLEREESVRVFYVAATRAEKKLFISGKVDKANNYEINEILKVDTWGKWFDLILSYKNISLEEKKWAFKMENGKTSYLKIITYDSIDISTINSLNYTNLLQYQQENNYLEFKDYTKPLVTTSKEKFFTISALKRYMQCPRYYFFYDKLNLSNSLEWFRDKNDLYYEEERGEDYETITNSLLPTIKGILVHELLEELTLFPERISTWSIILRNNFRLKGHNVNVIETDEWREFEQEVEIYIKNFQESRFCSNRLANSVMTEYDFILELNNGKIRGTIDRLEVDSHGSFSLIDYKTDKKIDKDKYKPQILTYALAIIKNYNFTPKNGIIYFIRHNHLEEFPINKEDLFLWEKDLEEILDKINKSMEMEDFGKNQNYCSTCLFNNLCIK